MFTREQEKLFLGLYGSAAVYKFDEGSKNSITFEDACRFWGMNEYLYGESLNQKLDMLRLVLADIESVVGETMVELNNGGCVSLEEVSLLAEVHEWLVARFSRNLSLLRNRNDRS